MLLFGVATMLGLWFPPTDRPDQVMILYHHPDHTIEAMRGKRLGLIAFQDWRIFEPQKFDGYFGKPATFHHQLIADLRTNLEAMGFTIIQPALNGEETFLLSHTLHLFKRDWPAMDADAQAILTAYCLDNALDGVLVVRQWLMGGSQTIADDQLPMGIDRGLPARTGRTKGSRLGFRMEGGLFDATGLPQIYGAVQELTPGFKSGKAVLRGAKRRAMTGFQNMVLGSYNPHLANHWRK